MSKFEIKEPCFRKAMHIGQRKTFLFEHMLPLFFKIYNFIEYKDWENVAQ